MFDLQEFLMRGYESGDVRQSITEVDEVEKTLSGQPATEFQSQGSEMSSQLSQGLSQGLSQLSQPSDGRLAVELNTSVNSNTNNNNNSCFAYDSSVGSGAVGGGSSGMLNDSIVSMEDMLAEFDAGDATPLPIPAISSTHTEDQSRFSLFPCDNPSTASAVPTSLLCPPPHPTVPSLSYHHPLSSKDSLGSNSVLQHQRQHSRSFNSGLNRLTVPGEPRQAQTLPKSVSTDMLSAEESFSKKKGGKGSKDKVRKGGSSKKKRLAGSTEALAAGSNRKPPSGKAKKNKLVLEPRGPFYGDDGDVVELRRHSALLSSSSSHLSELTSVRHHCTEDVAMAGDQGEEGEEGEGNRRRLSLQPQEDDDSLCVTDFLQPQLSPEAEDKAVWQEYGQI